VRPIRLRAFSLSLVLVALCAGSCLAASFTFFEGTQYPLKVYTLEGREPGPTVMVQGGIQGDEMAGFLTAQILARSTVVRGSLIVIPRANVPSINVCRRQVNVDLNRRFDQDYNAFFEDRLARVIRFFLSKSDAFLHLHEGSGFYRPTYVDQLRNPRRYGQSVIIDALSYEGLELAGLVNDVLPELNAGLPEDRRFHLFNTDTFATSTAHAEQRKSLTYHALVQQGIPALAIEVSKDLKDLEWKVRQQYRAARLFLARLGVEVVPPEGAFDFLRSYPAKPPRLSVNGLALAAGGATRLTLPAYTALEVAAEPGEAEPLLDTVPAVFASDRLGVNLALAPRMPMSPFSSLEIRCDGKPLAQVRIDWQGQWRPVKLPDRGLLLVCWLNGQLRFVPPDGTLEATVGDQLLIEGLWNGVPAEILNIKGIVSQSGPNTGQDAGCEIILDPATFWAGYLERESAASVCKVVRETPGQAPAEFAIRLNDRRPTALVLVADSGRVYEVPWADRGDATLPPGRYTLKDSRSNGPRDKLLPMLDDAPLTWGEVFHLSLNQTRQLILRQATTFDPLGSMSLAAGEPARVAARDAP